MGSPLYKHLTNRRTGEQKWVTSADDGATWEPGDPTASAPAAQPVAEAAPALPAAPPTPPVQRPAPVAAPQQAMTGREAAERAQGGFGDWLGRKAGEAVDTAGDLARGIGRGVTFDAMAPASAAIEEGLESFRTDDGTGIPKIYSAGSRQQSTAQANRAADARGQARSPAATAIGQGLGMAPAAVASTALTGPAGLVAAPVAMGLLSRSGASDAPDAEQWAGETFDPKAVLTDATIGAALPVGARALGAGAPTVAAGARKLGYKSRAGASGAYGGELAKLEKETPGFAQKFGEYLEKNKIGDRPGGRTRTGGALTGGVGGALYGAAISEDESMSGRAENAAKYGLGGAAIGAAAKLPVPSTPAVYAENATRLRATLGNAIDETIAEATEQGVQVSRASLLARLRGVRSSIPNNTTDEGALRQRVQAEINKARENYGDTVSPSELHSLKLSYRKAAGFDPKKTYTDSDSAMKQQFRKMGTKTSDLLKSSIVEMAEQTETAPRFAQATADYGMASTAARLGTKRVAQEAGNQGVSLPAAATGSAAAGAAMEGVKRVGKDVMADAYGTASRALGGSSTARSLTNSGATTAITAGSAAATQHQQSAQTDKKFREHLREQSRKKEGR